MKECETFICHIISICELAKLGAKVIKHNNCNNCKKRTVNTALNGVILCDGIARCGQMRKVVRNEDITLHYIVTNDGAYRSGIS